MKIKLWLKDGSVFEGVTLVGAELKVSGLPFDTKSLAKMEDTYLYTTAGGKIFRERVTGTLELNIPGIAGSFKLNVDQVKELVPAV